jgi:hypothetical protein
MLPLLAAVIVPAASAAHPPQVAFKQLAGLRYGIVRVDQTGANAVELTRGRPEPHVFGDFSWSPDGSRLVYAAEGIAGGDLYVLDGDSGDATQLTVGGGNLYPAWSPDGRSIAYVHTDRVKLPSGRYRLDEELWLVAADGRDPHPLTHDAGEKNTPRWSPDGSRLLYGRFGAGSDGKFGTFVVDAGTGRVLLQTSDYGGVWSPDGSRIALGASGGIDVVDADGSGRHRVAADAGAPAWSPDGTRIAFSRSHCTPGLKGLCGVILGSVFTVGADGRGERRLTGPISGGPGSELDGFPNDDSFAPEWWPDGSRLFFFRRSTEAYAMNADGTCEEQFGPEKLLLAAPAWRPGATPSLPPLRCVDVRVRAALEKTPVGLREEGRVHVTIENDGNETATDVKLTLRVGSALGRVQLPLSTCRGTSVIECDLPPLAAGGSTELVLSFTHAKPIFFRLDASVAARDTQTRKTFAYVWVIDCDIAGTEGPDTLVGTSGRDRICGLPGADVIRAGAGNDTIVAGAGADTVVPGPGRDFVVGGEGRDLIYARDGERDVIDCGPYLDRVFADRIDKLVKCERVFRRTYKSYR